MARAWLAIALTGVARTNMLLAVLVRTANLFCCVSSSCAVVVGLPPPFSFSTTRIWQLYHKHNVNSAFLSQRDVRNYDSSSCLSDFLGFPPHHKRKTTIVERHSMGFMGFFQRVVPKIDRRRVPEITTLLGRFGLLHLRKLGSCNTTERRLSVFCWLATLDRYLGGCSFPRRAKQTDRSKRGHAEREMFGNRLFWSPQMHVCIRYERVVQDWSHSFRCLPGI